LFSSCKYNVIKFKTKENEILLQLHVHQKGHLKVMSMCGSDTAVSRAREGSFVTKE